ncbi:MAG: hypothetical protein O3A92_06245, partial [Verrucomicrobia bacterium]|nr:hypothetical protein [Verrucomicrobiota bacterium]
MYRVHKRKGSPYYWADISVPDPVGDEPTRIRQSTKKTRKGEALVAAATMEEAAMRRVGADKDTSDAVLAALEDA